MFCTPQQWVLKTKFHHKARIQNLVTGPGLEIRRGVLVKTKHTPPRALIHYMTGGVVLDLVMGSDPIFEVHGFKVQNSRDLYSTCAKMWKTAWGRGSPGLNLHCPLIGRRANYNEEQITKKHLRDASSFGHVSSNSCVFFQIFPIYHSCLMASSTVWLGIL